MNVYTNLDVSVDSSPPDRMLLSEEDQGTSHDWDVLQHLLLHLGQGGDVGEVPLVLARHPLGSLQIRDLSSNQVGEDTDRDKGLVVLLEDGLVGVGDTVGDQHDGLVGLGSLLLGSVSLEQSEGSGESGGEVSNLHCLDVIDGLSELCDVLIGGLDQLRLPVTVSEALHQGLGLIREGQHCHEVILTQSLHDVDDYMLGNLLPQTSH